MPKVTQKTATKETSTQAVKLSQKALQAINAAISVHVTAEGAKQAAIATAEQSIVKLADAIAGAGFPDRDSARDYVKPLLEKAYTDSKTIRGDVKLYTGSQLSRVLGLAFPKTPAIANQIAKAKAANIGVNDLIAVSTGGKALNKKNELVTVKKDNRGGKNRKTPLEAYTAAIEAAVTAANVAKLDLEQMVNPFVASLVACEVVTDASEVRDAIED